jgi:hypothetical protein
MRLPDADAPARGRLLPADRLAIQVAALLAAALAAGAEGLTMGSCRSRRTLEQMLGGVTEHALGHVTLPRPPMH